MSKHVQHSPSKAKRWLNCPGSISAEEGLPDSTSVHALAGTRAHLLTSARLEARVGIREASDVREILAEEWCDEEMVEAVDLYMETIEPLLVEGAAIYVETFFDLTVPLEMPAPLAGTADCTVFVPIGGGLFRLVVIDFKYGKGVPVAADDPQLLIYAMGAAATHGKEHPVSEVETVIVQPRARHADGPVRRRTVSALDLVDWAADIRDAVAATLAPDAPRSAGDWCKFCKAAGTCPALRTGALQAAQAEFSDPPAPADFGPDELGLFLSKAALLDEWIGAVREHAQRLMEQGVDVPGWKLVPKRAIRKWRDEEEAERVLSRVIDDPYQPRKLLSPAGAEKAVGKKAFAALGNITVAESSGFNLAPTTDPRQAVTGRGARDEFAALD